MLTKSVLQQTEFKWNLPTDSSIILPISYTHFPLAIRCTNTSGFRDKSRSKKKS